MDRTIWRIVLRSIHRASRRLAKPRRRPQFSDSLIVAMFLWSVWQHRPLSWACQRGHYGAIFRPRKLPSISQFTRRIKTSRCQRILQQVHDELAQPYRPTSVSYLDGKSILVGPVSRDKNARRGWVSGGSAKGYKLHAWVLEDGRIPLWSLTPLNTGEALVAQELCRRLPMLGDDSLVLADTAYDSKYLYNLVAQHNGRLLAKLKGAAEHPSTLRQMGPVRREALASWRELPLLSNSLMRQRVAVENVFSRICRLSHLPAWARGQSRVTRWVGGQLILYHARLNAQKQLRTAVA